MPTVSTDKKFLSLGDVAKRWGVSVRTVQREVSRGKLAKTSIGGFTKFAKREVIRYEKQNQAT